MLIPFDEMPGNARVWIYQSDRAFDSSELKIIDSLSFNFFKSWAAHGNPLKSSFKVYHDKFLVISVDESFNQASGCSIDASVALIRQIENELKVNFFDRTRVSFISDGKIFNGHLTDLKGLIENGKIQKETLTFNNLVTNIDELNKNWMVPAGESWLSRYF